VARKNISGIVQNISTNPFQTFSKKQKRNSTFLSFDISFDIVDEDGQTTHVWFNRSFRLPPQLHDSDQIEVVGKFGQLFGVIGRNNFYAVRIIDRVRGMEYTHGRNKELEAELMARANARAAEDNNLGTAGNAN
jgi:hypothetical protein